jgi:hypothetical protein
MRASTAVLLAALCSSCVEVDMTTKQWQDRVQRNEDSADSKWGRVGADWDAQTKDGGHSPDPGLEQGDEVRWGASTVFNLVMPAGPGAYFSQRQQLIQVQRPPRTWSIQLSTTLLSPTVPFAPGELIDSFFLIDYGTGSSTIHTLETQQMVMPPIITDWMPQPIVVSLLQQKPAKQIIVTAFVRFFTVDPGAPARTVSIKVDAAAAPQER